MIDTEIVSELRRRLVDKVGQDRFELWFAQKTRFELVGGVLTVFVPNRFHQDWLRSHFRGEVEAVAAGVVEGDVAIEFRVDRKLDTTCKPKSPPADSVQRSLPHLEGDTPANAESVEPRTESSAAARSKRKSRRFARLSDFVVGESNRVAHAAVELACAEPGRATPLLIHGPCGVGKTHLMQGMWSAMRKSDRRRRCVYLTAEQFTTYFLDALHGSGLPSFRRKHRGADLLIVDDVQFLAGKRATLVELLSSIDSLVADSAQVVMTADRPLSELKELGPEFAGRMAGGLVCGIDTPEFETRLGIVSHFARLAKVELPRDVRHYIAKSFVSSARQLCGAVNRLHATSLAHREPIERTLAQRALADLVRHHTPTIGLAQIESAICETFGLESEKLRGNSRTRSVAQPRMLAMWLARKHTPSALSEIGDYFGRRTHSTVISAQRKVDYWMSDGEQLQLAGRNWTAREALDEVEQRLRRVS
ncbi:MAG: chromosomal replication initiator protein DnaA [Pirellulales bacterium]|nr:chromosomal replication initiator protein DnaA [Pirellulales bacterium]